MSRRTFISFAKRDLTESPRFDLIALGEKLGAEVVARQIEEPATAALAQHARELLESATATVVLVGRHAAASAWIAREIEWTLDAGKGLLGILLDPSAEIPDALFDAGAEILDLNDPFDAAHLQPALAAAERGARILSLAAQGGTGSGESCARPLR